MNRAGRPAGLVSEVIEAHGGLTRWRSVDEVALRISTGGLLFALKGQRTAVRDLEARVSRSRRSTLFERYPGPGLRGIFEDGSVRIETNDGDVVAARADARNAFRTPRHRLWWDKLDMLYFCGYALWTYLSIPFVLAEPGYEVRDLEPWTEGGERWRRVQVRFPAGIHTHCREQTLYFDGKGLLRRHDYTPEIIGARAKAAHYCLDPRSFDGLIFPTRRRVYPRRGSNTPLKALTLVWIELGSLRSAPS